MNAPNRGAGIASKPRGQQCPDPRGRQCPETKEPAMPRTKEPAMPRTKEPAMPRNHGAGIALIQGAGNAPISAGDRSVGSAANAKNRKSQESSFLPATFRHSLFVKLYVFPSERNCCGSQPKCRCQRQYDPKPWLAAVSGLSGFIISSSFVGIISVGGSCSSSSI